MAKIDTVKTFMVKLKLVVENGVATVFSTDGLKVVPVPIMFRGGNCYADADVPMKAIGYQIHSVQEDFGSSDDSPEITFNYEIEPLKDTEHWNTAKILQYLDNVVKPTIAFYLAETVEAARKANEFTETAIENNPEFFESK